VVEITDGTAEYNNKNYRLSLFYDLAKTSVIRIAWALAQELQPYHCTAVALTGWLRSELMLDYFGVSEANWQDATAKEPHFIISETPHYVDGLLLIWLVIRKCLDGMVNRFPVVNWHRFTALPISMALSPMLGVTSGRYRRWVNLPMLLDTDNVRVTELLRIAFYLIRDPWLSEHLIICTILIQQFGTDWAG